MGFRKLRAVLKQMMAEHIIGLLKKTPFHPQWLALLGDPYQLVSRLEPGKGDRILDIGCGRGWLKTRLPDGIEYIGFDYPATGIDRYHAEQDILGSAEALPFDTNSMDVVVCLEVMEHLPDPFGAVAEIARVLRPGGRAAISIPFAYPIHDAPFDFQRLTSFQLKRLVEQSDLRIEYFGETIHALESAALLANLAFGKTVLDGIKRKHPIALLLPVLVVLVPIINLSGWLGARFAGKCGTSFLPGGYQMILGKPPK